MGEKTLDGKWMIVHFDRPADTLCFCKCVCVAPTSIVLARLIKSLVKVSARHLAHCLLHTSFVCVHVCVYVKAGSSSCLLTLPSPHYCVQYLETFVVSPSL